MLLDFKSSTTFSGGSGWEAVVPQFTPIAPALDKTRLEMANNSGSKELRFEGIAEERERSIVFSCFLIFEVWSFTFSTVLWE